MFYLRSHFMPSHPLRMYQHPLIYDFFQVRMRSVSRLKLATEVYILYFPAEAFANVTALRISMRGFRVVNP